MYIRISRASACILHPTTAVDPVLVVGGTADIAATLVDSLRELGRAAIRVECREAALEVIAMRDLAAIIVNVNASADWTTCRHLAQAGHCPVAVVTHLYAPDRRYRQRAFDLRAAAYVCHPCTKGKLRAMLLRFREGEVAFELTENAAYSA